MAGMSLPPPTEPLATPLQQSPEFARALRAFGTPLRCDAPVVMMRRFGPVAVTFASRLSVAALEQRPRLVNGEEDAPDQYRAAGYRQILTPAHVAQWNLNDADLTVAMHGKWRNALRKGESHGMRLRRRDWDGRPHPLFTHAQRLAENRGFRTYPVALLSTYAAENPGKAFIVEAYHQGLVAACLVLRHGGGATYQTAWASAAGKKLNAPRVVLMRAAEHLHKTGTGLFDLGPVETDHAPGLARFKLGTGADLRRLGGTWLRVR